MRIIAFVNSNSGPAYHRIILPLLLMPEDVEVYITNDLQVKDFEKGCDIFMYNRILPDHAMSGIAELKAKYGFKTVVDIDDYWELDPHHVLYQEYQDIDFASQQIEHIRGADLVLTTHSRLAADICHHNKNVEVCANAIPRQGQFDIAREPYFLTRLFWQGSVTHRRDIEILERPIDGLNTIASKIKMVMAGYQENDPEWHLMALGYTCQLKHQYKLIPGTPVDRYYSHYAHADICLVPLVNSRFNSHKSNLKILEAANMGLPVIASDVHPYKDMPLLYCKCASDWVKHISRLVASKKRQREAGQELAEFCEKHYNFHKINNVRKQILEYEAGK